MVENSTSVVVSLECRYAVNSLVVVYSRAAIIASGHPWAAAFMQVQCLINVACECLIN